MTLYIISCILLGISTGLFEMFFQRIMHPGMIFHWYLKLISKVPKWLAKPLGYCHICNGTWMMILVSVYFGDLIMFFISVPWMYISSEIVHNKTNSVFIIKNQNDEVKRQNIRRS